jgi:rRNA-processing protein FCF1
MTDELLLKTDVTVDQALRILKELKSGVDNVRTGGGQMHHRQRAYLEWVETAELQLRRIFVSSEQWQSLQTNRYWYIRSLLAAKDPRPHPVIGAEAEWQFIRLERMEQALTDTSGLLDLPAGWVALVPDTNVLVHSLRFDQVKWDELLGSPVRLILPVVVLDELDDLSYRSNPATDRAKGVLKTLRMKLRKAPSLESAFKLTERVALQLFANPVGHSPRSNRDDELLVRTEFIASFLGERVSLATGDLGMQLRASVRNVKVFLMPEKTRLPAVRSKPRSS